MIRINRIIEQREKKYFIKIDKEESNENEINDFKMKIIVTDGKSVWESSNSKLLKQKRLKLVI